MRAKLYSGAHVETAKRIFPDKYKQKAWLDSIWTDAEINACKFDEMSAFINAPGLSTYPHAGLLEPQAAVPEEFNIVDKYLSSLAIAAPSFLSIGCGLWEKELRLARSHPEVSFTAIDNAPHVESLNELASQLGIRNIVFKNCDLRNLGAGKYDVVYSFGVIYCIPDDSLPGFFNLLAGNLADKGTAFVGCSSNYSFVLKAQMCVLEHMGKTEADAPVLKQSGWLRDSDEVRRFIPGNIMVKGVFQLDHLLRSRLVNKTGLGRVLALFSERIIPLSNSSYLFVLSGNCQVRPV